MLRELLRLTPDPLAVDALTKALPEYLDAALDELRLAFGSVETYLREAAGVDGAMQERLRQRLLESGKS